MIIAGNLSILFMATMPFVAFFEDVQALNHLLVNTSLFLIIYAFLKHFFYQSKKENKILKEYEKNKTSKYTEENILKNYNLSITEAKVASLMLQDLTHIEIGIKLNSAPKTISKQASDIYKKVSCKNKKELLNIIREQKSNNI
jgi:DNA-binding NarL/FixJ family response regulator